MNIIVERQPKCLATLRVEVPAATVSQERQIVISSYAKQAKVPGFRPGKTPATLIEKRYKSEIQEELEARLIDQSFDHSLKTEGLRVLNFGNPQGLTFHNDGTFTFSTLLTLAPEFSLPEYKGIAIELPTSEPTEEEIQQKMEELRKHFSSFDNITDRAIEKGDFAVVDFKTTLNGTPLEEAIGKTLGDIAGRDAFWIQVSDDDLLPGYADGLVGASVGDQRDIAVTIPDTFPTADLQQKEIVFHTTIKEIKQQQLPELDDAFAARLLGDHGTIDDLKEKMIEMSRSERNREIEESKVNQIVKFLDDAVDFDVSEELLQSETQHQIDSMVNQAMREGLNGEQIEAAQAEIFERAARNARVSIKTNFILQEIANAEKLVVSDQELISHLVRIAEQQKTPIKDLIKKIQRAGRLQSMRNSLLINKAIDFLVSCATVQQPSSTSALQSES